MPLSRNPASLVLPAIGRSARRTIAILGNSIDGQTNNWPNNGWNTTGASQASPVYLLGGYAAWALALSHQRVKLPKTHVMGYPTRTVGEFANPALVSLTGGLSAILALTPKPDLVIVGCATNNLARTDGQQTLDFIINGGTIGGVSYMGYAQIFAALLGAGIKVVVRPVGPRGDVVLTAAQVGVALAVNRWLLEVARRDLGVYVPRYLRNLVDPTSTLYGAKAGILNLGDNLHPATGSGCFYMGQDIAAIINQLYPQVDMLGLNAAVASASAPYGNLLMATGAAQFMGTGGAGNNLGTGSVVPPAWSVTKPSGDTALTLTTSVVPSTVDPAFNALQLTYSGSFTPNGTGAAVDQTHSDFAGCYLPPGNSAAGDVLEGFIGFEIDAGLTGVTAPQVTLRDGPNTYYNLDIFPGLGGQFPGVACSGVLTTSEFLATAAFVGSGAFFGASVARKGDVNTSVNCAGTMRFTRPTLLKTLPY